MNTSHETIDSIEHSAYDHAMSGEVKEKWEDILNNSRITGHVSGRHLICISEREDFNDENEYYYLDEWIKRIIKEQRSLAQQEILDRVEKVMNKVFSLPEGVVIPSRNWLRDKQSELLSTLKDTNI